MAGDHPDVPFLQAEHYRAGRPDGPPLWIVWHTMEEDELADTAERVARYFAFNTGDRTVSSHYCADSDSIVQCVRLGDVAYTVGNRPGNNRGINVELAGRASQTAAQWADPYSQAMLKRMCVIAARDMAKYAIPNRWCTVSDLLARRPGHTTHNDLRLAFGGTTHTDPGTGFPRSQVLALVAGGEDDDMAVNMDNFYAMMDAYTHGLGSWKTTGGSSISIKPPAAPADLVPLATKLDQLLARTVTVTLTDAQVQVIADKLVAAPDNPLGEADKPAIVAAVKQALREGAV